MSDQVLIIGASARAAASSARLAGFDPVTLDLFCDVDTQELATARKISGFSNELVSLLHTLPVMPWLYTGGLEHYPNLINHLTNVRPLWGNDGDSVLEVRSPIELVKAFKFVGFRFAESVLKLPANENPNDWLIKPLQGGGGRGIIRAKEKHSGTIYKDFFFQKYYPGLSYSAVFFSFNGECSLLGTTQQLIGPQAFFESQNPPFSYAGNIAPHPLHCNAELFKIGSWLTTYANLEGVWGMDFGLSQGRPVVYEINPRYTASVEVLEKAYSFKVFDYYRAAYLGGPKPEPAIYSPTSAGKFVVYAAEDFTFPQHGPWNLGRQYLADITPKGETCLAGQPVLTILQCGELEEVWNGLKRQYEQLKQYLPLL